MKTTEKVAARIIALSLLAAAAIPLAAFAADEPPKADAPRTVVAQADTTPGQVASSPCADATLPRLQQRLIEKYDQGQDLLLQFVWRTRSIHLLDRGQTAQWAEDYRSTHSRC
ncbi:hypothetical protein GCM10027034_27280 [Ramlibacter solisilvae]|uniref:Secreted protein n=1 Tax=Ramlibacter tataouinensis TaxID=94132 RepID=A0A127JQR7_9BURK|nr:hypothetical protein [Ramlibacter tataouinensis]AMO22384.1 hypothetical protein UC35_05060 [Ramlibacter tataouinensis]